MPLRNRKTVANTHDKRHENGLAQPTKKVAKSRSDISAARNGNGAFVNPSLAKIVVDAEDDSDDQSSSDGIADGTSAPITMAASRKTSLDGASEGHSDSSVNTPPEEQEPVASTTPRDAVNGNVQRHGSFSMPSSATDLSTTIIWPHALWDVVAVLLFLLQLPPLVLIAVQTCFIFITFGNPLSGWTLASLTSSYAWFHGYNGNPSIVTTVLADLMFFLAWFSVSGLVPILKDIILDAAQGVIALYLGGGTNVKGGWSHTLVCVSVVTIPHLIRATDWQRYGASRVESMLSNSNPGLLGRIPIFLSSHYTAHSWTRTFLEIHTMAQGIVRLIRRWFDRQPGTSSTKKLDPEAAATPSSAATAAPIDSNSEGARNASTDGRPPGLPPVVKEKEKPISSGKKRRKQGNFVRRQQPFWAAIASTKISMTKVTEHTQAPTDAQDAAIADAVRAGEGKQSRGEDRVWIERIEQTEVWFTATIDAALSDSQNAAISSDIKPVSVRVNGARWSQIDVKEMDFGGEGTDVNGVLTGRIFGLIPSENYFVEFLEGRQCRVFYSTHLMTRPLANSDSGPTIIATQPQDALRPSSPITTLNKSIATAASQLKDIQARSRKLRRDHRSSNSALKKEVEGLEAKLSVNANDDRVRQKYSQLLHSIKQAEDSVAQITTQLDSLGDLPETEREEYESRKRVWEEAKSQYSAAREDLECSKADVERELNVKRSAIASDRQKKERSEARLGKLEQARENLVSTNALVRKEKLRKESLRNQTLISHQNKERDILSSITYCESQRQDWEARQFHAQEQVYYLENSFNTSMNGQTPNAHTPESSFSGLTTSHRATAFGNLPYPIGAGPVVSHSRTNSNRPTTRGRSSSMLSEISGFTEDETEPTSSTSDFTSAGQGIARNSSAGSTAAGSVVGSQRDARSPGAKFSPVGTEASKASPRLYKVYS